MLYCLAQLRITYAVKIFPHFSNKTIGTNGNSGRNKKKQIEKILIKQIFTKEKYSIRKKFTKKNIQEKNIAEEDIHEGKNIHETKQSKKIRKKIIPKEKLSTLCVNKFKILYSHSYKKYSRSKNIREEDIHER